MKRWFMKPGPEPINERIHHVEVDIPEDGEGGMRMRGMRADGRDNGRCPWRFKDAISLVESGHWIEVAQTDDGTFYQPTEGQLEELARGRTMFGDAPHTVVEMVW